MKKMFSKLTKAALFAAMVISVALTGCNGKKGNASSLNSYAGADLAGNVSSSNTAASAETDSVTSSREQIDAFLRDYEKFVEKAESTAEKGDLSSIISLEAEAVKFVEKSDEFEDMSDWNGDDSEKLLKLTNRYTESLLKLSNSMDSSLNGLF